MRFFFSSLYSIKIYFNLVKRIFHVFASYENYELSAAIIAAGCQKVHAVTHTC